VSDDNVKPFPQHRARVSPDLLVDIGDFEREIEGYVKRLPRHTHEDVMKFLVAFSVVTLRVIFRWEEERVTRLVEYALDEAEKGAPIK
jgi:hypothetical protein